MLQGLNYIDQLQRIDFIFLITGLLRLNLGFCFVHNTRVPPDGNVKKTVLHVGVPKTSEWIKDPEFSS